MHTAVLIMKPPQDTGSKPNTMAMLASLGEWFSQAKEEKHNSKVFQYSSPECPRAQTIRSVHGCHVTEQYRLHCHTLFAWNDSPSEPMSGCKLPICFSAIPSLTFICRKNTHKGPFPVAPFQRHQCRNAKYRYSKCARTVTPTRKRTFTSVRIRSHTPANQTAATARHFCAAT